MNANLTQPYDALSSHYDLFQGALSSTTWNQGVLFEIRQGLRKTGYVFDAGAGTGIGARLLKEHGRYRVTSCDCNSSMLLQAKKHSDRLVLAHLSSIPALSHKFDFVVSGFDALNYLKAHELGRFFLWCRNHLAADGRLIFDYSSPHLLREHWLSMSYQERFAEWTLDWSHKYNFQKMRAEIVLTCFLADTVLWREVHYQYSANRSEMAALAHRAGLQIIKVRDLENSGFSSNARTHVFVMTIAAG